MSVLVNKGVYRAPPNARTFDIYGPLNVPLRGTITDWPSQVQDVLYAMVDVKARQLGIALQIVHASCSLDFDDMPFAWVVVQEVVLAEPERKQ